MSILDNVGAPGGPGPESEYINEDEAFQEEFPGIFEFLARVRYHGNDRLPGRLIVYYEPGKASLCLSDKQSGSVAFHAGEGVQEALEGLERRLQGGTVDWRKDKKARYQR